MLILFILGFHGKNCDQLTTVGQTDITTESLDQSEGGNSTHPTNEPSASNPAPKPTKKTSDANSIRPCYTAAILFYLFYTNLF